MAPLTSRRRSRASCGGEQSFFGALFREQTRKERFDESDIKRRELGVAFEDLRVVGQASTATYQPTVGSELNPFKIVEIINNIRHPALRDLLSGFEGCVRPGEMLRKFLFLQCSHRNISV